VEIKRGDRVRYRADWLRSIGMHTGALPAARGTVTDSYPVGSGSLVLVTVKWDNDILDEIPKTINAKNLEVTT
jgi:hypothetical protein